MSYTIDYSKVENPKEKAIEDCKFWLGKTFTKVENILVDGMKSYTELTDEVIMSAAFSLSFVGISGYAATALIEHCFNKSKLTSNEKVEQVANN